MIPLSYLFSFSTHWYMNYLHVCWLCSSEFHFALAFDVVVAASCFLLRIQKHLSREILPHTLEVKRSSRSQPDLIFCSNILSSGHHSSQLAISYKIQYHIQQQQHSQNHQVINHKRIFALFPPGSLRCLGWMLMTIAHEHPMGITHICYTSVKSRLSFTLCPT